MKSRWLALVLAVSAPVWGMTITNVTVSNITPTSATISWTTDKPSNSFVAYGQGRGGLTTDTGVLQAERVPAHKVVLSDLFPDRNYKFVIRSQSAGGKA